MKIFLECSEYPPGPHGGIGTLIQLLARGLVRSGHKVKVGEAAKASRFRFDRDRDAFMVARGMLRALLRRYLGDRPDRIRFVYGFYGKPALAP